MHVSQCKNPLYRSFYILTYLQPFSPYLTPLPIRKIPLMNFQPLLSKLVDRMPEVTHIRSLTEYWLRLILNVGWRLNIAQRSEIDPFWWNVLIFMNLRFHDWLFNKVQKNNFQQKSRIINRKLFKSSHDLKVRILKIESLPYFLHGFSVHFIGYYSKILYLEIPSTNLLL